MASDGLHINIRKAREALGLSQTAMAEALGVGRNTYISFESGKTRLFGKTLSLLARYIGKNEIDILLGVDISRTVLEEISDSESRLSDMRAFYERELSVRDERIEAGKALIAMLQKENLELLSDKKALVRTNSYLLEQLETKK